ncbi:MAG: hypothetical protein E7343_04085 [Clostridiales bacterium]|nr:hypothetical protein [Clostridiales bacterium]
MNQVDVIKSIGYDEQEIINNILVLYNKGNSIDFDPCYNVGGFYRNNVVQSPDWKSDINPLLPGVEKFDVRELPFKEKFKCIIFDPPFIVAGDNSIMGERYGYFDSVTEMRSFWVDSLFSLQGALKRRGILIVKCQDFVIGRKNYIFLHEVISMARDSGFKILDLFILLSKTRAIRIKTQQHARKYHSYFLVLKKL